MNPFACPIAAAVLSLAAGCTPFADEPQSTGGAVSLRTYGDLATAATRARLACGEPEKLPNLAVVTGAGADQVAVFNCM